MARIEWVRHRLENWARWSARRGTGGLGYPKQTTFARLVASGGGNDGIPVSELEASETDDAVRALQLSKSHLYLTLDLHYAQALSIDKVSRRLHKAPSTIKRHLEDGDRAIAEWLDAKREAQRKARELSSKS